MGFFPFNTGAQGLVAPVNLQGAAGANPVFAAGTTGDAFNRTEIDANGGIRFGTGAGAPDATLSRQAINVLQSSGKFVVNGIGAISGNLDVFAVGSGLQVAEGSNAKQGIATLVAGTVTVANTSVTANSRILLTTQAPGGTAGFLVVSARVAGTSFTILSSNAADTSVVAYEIFEPG